MSEGERKDFQKSLIMKLSETPETLHEVHSVSICSPSPTYSIALFANNEAIRDSRNTP